MGWMAEALHRSIGNWTAGASTTCIGSEKERKVVESQNVDQIARRCMQGSHMSWIADVHRLR